MLPGPGRFAIYYAPPRHSRLWRFGSAWLGRDAATGHYLEQPPVSGLNSDWLRAITAKPRSYGLHATLKPPFVLARGRTSEQLQEQLQTFATNHESFVLPLLQLQAIDGFVALGLTEDCPALVELASACVTEFDDFRAPPSPAELALRRQTALTPRQWELLDRWGYPFVLDAFRFHLTLTDRLKRGELERALDVLRPLVEPLLQERLTLDEICLFAQDNREAPLQLIRAYPLATEQ